MTSDNFPQTSRRCTRALVAPLVAASLIVTTVPIGVFASAQASVTVSKPKPPSWSQVKDARQKLLLMSAAVGKSKAQAERAQAQLTEAEQRVTDAQAAVADAKAAVELAKQAVIEAQQKVDAQKLEVAKQQRIIDDLLVKVSQLARSTYIDGGEYQTLAMILETESPADYATQREAVKRTSTQNAKVYDELMAAKALLEDKLADLQNLKEATDARASEARSKQQVVERAEEAAVAAAADAEAITGKRNEALAVVERERGEIRRTFNELLDKYEAAHAGPGETGSTRVPGAHNQPGRTGRDVVEWAMQYVGNGEWYDHLCLGFVDDAYDAPGDARMPRAIDQWYRAENAGFAHPDDRTPPIGAQVFWWSGNPAKHIAIYAGDGMVITTGGDGARVAILSMDDMDAWGPYLGWAPGYYG